MTKRKQIKELSTRLSILEGKVEKLISSLSSQSKGLEEKTTYEEVINEWLCGKEAT